MKDIKKEEDGESALWREMIMKQLADGAESPRRIHSCCVWSLQTVTHFRLNLSLGTSHEPGLCVDCTAKD